MARWNRTVRARQEWGIDRRRTGARAVSRAESINPHLNAIIHESYAAACDNAVGLDDSSPLAGVPMVINDFVCREAGRPFHEGSQFLKDIAYVSDYDQELAVRFRQAGLVPIGL